MRTGRFCCLAVAAVMVGFAARPAVAEDPKDKAKEEAAIEKNAVGFIAAFKNGDAKALAAFWAPDGDYTDQSGNLLKGREAIEKAFKEAFAESKGLQLKIDSHALRFLTPDVAIEDGTTEVISPDGGPPSRTRYTIVHVKKDGQWLLGSVRDAPFAPPSNYENLKGLEWLVGDWAGENDKGESEHLSLDWTENQNFLTGTFTARVKGVSVGSSTHWIGWDPTTKRVRSWLFDATGGFGDGAWTRDGGKWTVKTSSTLQDGKKATATITIARVDDDTVTFQSKERTVDGKPVPDGKEFKLKRAK